MTSEETRFMALANAMAKRALGQTCPNPPVGAVIVARGDVNQVVGRGWTQSGGRPHAEIVALEAAGERARDATLFVTLEPCAMCAGAIILSRIPEVYFGAYDPKAGCSGSLMNLLSDVRFNHRPHVVPEVMAEECGAILSSFFREIRSGRRPGSGNGKGNYDLSG